MYYLLLPKWWGKGHAWHNLEFSWAFLSREELSPEFYTWKPFSFILKKAIYYMLPDSGWNTAWAATSRKAGDIINCSNLLEIKHFWESPEGPKAPSILGKPAGKAGWAEAFSFQKSPHPVKSSQQQHCAIFYKSIDWIFAFFSTNMFSLGIIYIVTANLILP